MSGDDIGTPFCCTKFKWRILQQKNIISSWVLLDIIHGEKGEMGLSSLKIVKIFKCFWGSKSGTQTSGGRGGSAVFKEVFKGWTSVDHWMNGIGYLWAGVGIQHLIYGANDNVDQCEKEEWFSLMTLYFDWIMQGNIFHNQQEQICERTNCCMLCPVLCAQYQAQAPYVT